MPSEELLQFPSLSKNPRNKTADFLFSLWCVLLLVDMQNKRVRRLATLSFAIDSLVEVEITAIKNRMLARIKILYGNLKMALLLTLINQLG